MKIRLETNGDKEVKTDKEIVKVIFDFGEGHKIHSKNILEVIEDDEGGIIIRGSKAIKMKPVCSNAIRVSLD